MRKNLFLFLLMVVALTTCLDANAKDCSPFGGVTSAAGVTTGAAATATSWLPLVGVNIVAHSSGAAIATIGGAYVAGSMVALAALPVIATAGAVVTTAAGGAYLYCRFVK